jgi:hypothetical protein
MGLVGRSGDECVDMVEVDALLAQLEECWQKKLRIVDESELGSISESVADLLNRYTNGEQLSADLWQATLYGPGLAAYYAEHPRMEGVFARFLVALGAAAGLKVEVGKRCVARTSGLAIRAFETTAAAYDSVLGRGAAARRGKASQAGRNAYRGEKKHVVLLLTELRPSSGWKSKAQAHRRLAEHLLPTARNDSDSFGRVLRWLYKDAEVVKAYERNSVRGSGSRPASAAGATNQRA